MEVEKKRNILGLINEIKINLVSTLRLAHIARIISKVDNTSKLQILNYFERGCREPASNFEKVKFLSKFSHPDTYWIETGTFMGYTTRGLSARSKHVYSLEPSPKYFQQSTVGLSDCPNVSVINRTSEDGLLSIFEKIPSGSHVNLWLDGHYSAGGTFQGANKCPIPFELEVLEGLKSSYEFRVFVDDFRLFGVDDGYPEKDFLVKWSNKNGFSWTVENDIFIMSRKPLWETGEY